MTARANPAKALGLALLVALAMSATVAPAAKAAPEFTAVETVGIEHSSAYLLHALIEGESTQPHILSPSSVAGVLLRCKTSTFAATMAPGVDTELTATIGYGGCTATGTIGVHVRINGCDSTYKIASKVEPDLYKGTMDISCPANQSIELETTAMGAKRLCLDTVPAQVGIGPIYYRDMTDSTPTDITIVEEAENVTNITDNGFLACGGVAIGHHNDGTLFGETTIRASNTTGEFVDFEVSG